MGKEQKAAQSDSTAHGGAYDPIGVNSEIGRKLRKFYDEIVSDEVPDRFTELLSQLEAVDASRKKG